jgi:hypothetical protein
MTSTDRIRARKFHSAMLRVECAASTAPALRRLASHERQRLMLALSKRIDGDLSMAIMGAQLLVDGWGIEVT